MLLATSRLSLRRVLILTPFSHQLLALPKVKSLQEIMAAVVPKVGEGDRKQEIEAILQRLPAHCDAVRRASLQARRAARYYRSRYRRGMEAQKRLSALREASDEELHRWAIGKYMFSQRWGPLLLSPKLSFVVRNVAVEQQRAELQEVVHYHKVAVTHGTEQDVGDNKVSNNKNYGSYSTYDPVASVYFPTFQVALLPPTNGVHRATLRASLATDVVDDFRRHVVQAWQGAAARQAILIGCRSVPYMERQLEMDNLYSFLVIDRILSNLLDAAEMLVPKYGTRVHFLRSDAFFCVQQLLPSEVADVCVAPMPVPFVSERSSHQRLVTRDFLCAVHHVLRLRESPSDQRGFVTFTDFVPLGEFMMEQLEESRLIVPWTRKNPSETYGRWLPGEHKHICEFPRQRSSGGIVAIAASKSGGTSSQALAVIQQLEYKRRYHRALLSPTEG